MYECLHNKVRKYYWRHRRKYYTRFTTLCPPCVRSFFSSSFLSFSLPFLFSIVRRDYILARYRLDTDWLATNRNTWLRSSRCSSSSDKTIRTTHGRTRILFVFMARVRFANVLEVSSQPWHARLLRVTSNSTMFLQIFPSENSKIGDGRFRYTDGYDSEIIWKQFELFARKTNSLIEFSTMTRWLTIF